MDNATSSHNQASEPRDPLSGLTADETYCIGLFTGEMGEAAVEIGSGQRFGFDNAHPDNPDDSPRSNLSREAGDLEAAILFSKLHGLIDHEIAGQQREAKIRLLLSEAVDRTGRRLAPKVRSMSVGDFIAIDPLNAYRTIINLRTCPAGLAMAENDPLHLLDRFTVLCRIALGNYRQNAEVAEDLAQSTVQRIPTVEAGVASAESVAEAWAAERRRCTIRGIGPRRAVDVDGVEIAVIDDRDDRAHQKATALVDLRCSAAVLKALGLGPGPDITK